MLPIGRYLHLNAHKILFNGAKIKVKVMDLGMYESKVYLLISLQVNDSDSFLLVHTQVARDFDPMLGYCWPNVGDGGPTLTQHWVNVLC